MSFLESALDKQEELLDKTKIEKPVEEVKTEIEPPSGEPDKEPTKVEPVKTDEPVKVEVVEPVKEEVKTDEPKLTKKEIDYKAFLEQNEEALRQYLVEKGTDYKTLPQLDLVKRKIQAENPEFDTEDIENELEDRYGLSLALKEIDPATMDEDEIAEAKKENAKIEKQISKYDRALKKDAASASKYFEEIKGGLTLPKFEVDEEEKPAAVNATFNPEDYQKSLAEEIQKQKEENWIPQLKQVIDPLEAITEQVEYEDNGNKVVLDVSYKLSKEEKEELQNELNDYITQPSDSKYIDDKGVPDLQRFVEDKTKEFLYKKLIKTVAKESAALARKEFVKNDLLNFDDGIKQRGVGGNDDVPFAKGFFQAAASQSKNRL